MADVRHVRFYISLTLHREFILDGEWLKMNDTVLSLDPPTLTLGKENIPMRRDSVPQVSMLSQKDITIPLSYGNNQFQETSDP